MPGKPVQDFWDDVKSLAGLGARDDERAYYPTQKPETLLERIVQTLTLLN
jgi:DNA modification methylase